MKDIILQQTQTGVNVIVRNGSVYNASSGMKYSSRCSIARQALFFLYQECERLNGLLVKYHNPKTLKAVHERNRAYHYKRLKMVYSALGVDCRSISKCPKKW